MEEVKVEDVPAAVLADLRRAVLDLARVYCENAPARLVKYMNDRGEKLDPEMAEQIRSMLGTEGGVPAQELVGKSDEELLKVFWEASAAGTHWESVVENEGCLRIWKPRDF